VTPIKTNVGFPAHRHARYGYNRLVSAFRVACLCALVAGQYVAAQTPSSCSMTADTHHTSAPKLKLQGVPQFGQVTPTLYRGAQPTKEGLANLAKLGINIVVDLRGSRASERQVVTELGMKYVPLPWRCFSPHDEHFAQFLTLLRENPDKKIFVHCRVGDDRTGMDIAAYRMAEQGWTAEEARKEMVDFGVNWFHSTICPGLASYEKQFPEHFKASPAFKDLRSDKRASQPKP
jgi:tyrosine-protein phosphatase SIW14